MEISNTIYELPIYSKGNSIIGYFKCDLEDYDILKNYRIHANDRGYLKFRFKGKPMYVHRWIMNAKTGEIIDHIYGDKRDVRKSQLRITTCHQNNANRHVLSSSNTSGYRGVGKYRRGRWRAYVTINNKNIQIGVFDKVEDAAQAAANKRAELGYLDKGVIPTIIPVEHKKRPKGRGTGKSGKKYISWSTECQLWTVIIFTKDRDYFVGRYKDIETSIKIRNDKLRELNMEIPND